MPIDKQALQKRAAAQAFREQSGAKFMRATFDAPIWDFLNSTAPAAYLRGGNGGGKSYAAAWLVTAHALGRYPSNYTGWRPKPMADDAYAVKMIVMSQNSQVLRDAMQAHLIGDYAGGNPGNGLIPAASIVKIEASRGIAGCADFAIVRRDDGTLCQIFLRTYEQKRVSVQGIRANGGVYCDELFNDDELLGELLGRFSGVGGVFRLTATERFQSAPVAEWFYEKPDERKIYQFSLKQITRISDEDKAAFLANLPEAERDTRFDGGRFTGGGMVWTTPLEHVLCDEPPSLHSIDTRYLISLDFNHFGQSGTGSKFAALFWAIPSRYNGTAYLFREVLVNGTINDQAAALLEAGAEGIKIAWPHDGHQGTADGRSIVKLFQAFPGLRFYPTHSTMHAQPSAGYNREAGIELCNQLMSTGKLKVLRDLVQFRSQFSRYERDDKGQPIARNDDLMSAFRIGAMMLSIARPLESPDDRRMRREPRLAEGLDFDLFAT